MDSESGDRFIKRLAEFIRANEKALANALILEKKEAEKSRSSRTFGEALLLPYQNLVSLKPVKLSLTPHHLFYLLSRFEELGIAVGPMNVRLDNLHHDTSSANYVSFLNQNSKTSSRYSSHYNSTKSTTNSRADSGYESAYKSFGDSISGVLSALAGTPAGRSEKQKAQTTADLKYIYSAFTKLPCLLLAPDRNAKLIEGYEEFPFDTAVPLHAFKNVSVIEITDLDVSQFFGWDRIADYVRSLVVKRAGIDDLGELLVDLVVDDMDKRRRRSSKMSAMSGASSSSSPSYTTSPRYSSQPLARTIATNAADSSLLTVPESSEAPSIGSQANVQHSDQFAGGPPLVNRDNPSLRKAVAGANPSSHLYSSRSQSSNSDSSRAYSRSSYRTSSTISDGRSSNTSFSSRSNSAYLMHMGLLPSSKWRFLKHLGFPDNGLTSVPRSSLSSLAPTLHSLDLSMNLFDHIPASLGSLTSLRALNLSDCLLDRVDFLDHPIPTLTALNLRRNRIKSLHGLQHLPVLERLDIRENKLEDSAELKQDLPRLKEVWVAGNPFTARLSYRVDTFNFFRNLASHEGDISIDNSGPSSSEEKRLINLPPLKVPSTAKPEPQSRANIASPSARDGDSYAPSEVESIVSYDISTTLSRITSLDPNQEAAIEYLTDVFVRNPELSALCLDAQTQFGIQKFVRDFVRLLKQYFADLSLEATTQQQRQVINFLRGRVQRGRIAELLCGLADQSPSEENREAMKALRKQKVDRMLNLNRLLEPVVPEDPLGPDSEPHTDFPSAISPREPGETDSASYPGNPVRVGSGIRTIDFISPATLDVEHSPGSVHTHGSSEAGGDQVDSFDDDRFDTEILSMPQLLAVIEFLTKGLSFKTLILSLRYSVYPATELSDAVKSRDLETVQRLLAEKFDIITAHEYSWLKELDEVGYSGVEIAELLVEEATQSPWIYFERPSLDDAATVDVKRHQPLCVHNGGQSLLHTPPLISDAVTSDLSTSAPPISPTGMEEVNQLIEEHCGLAGVAPSHPDPTNWIGSVEFEDEQLIATVTYSIQGVKENSALKEIARIRNVLDGFLTAVAQVQSLGLCCDSFTIIREMPGASAVHQLELQRVHLSLATTLRDKLEELEKLFKRTMSLETDLTSANKRCQDSASKILGVVDENWSTGPLHWVETTNLCSLAVQFLCLGLLSYSHAHSGALQPFFLDCPIEHIILLGMELNSGFTEYGYLDARLERLTCMGDMIQDSVLVFRKLHWKEPLVQEEQAEFDLLASPEDLMDTWGPGQFLMHPNEIGDVQIRAINIGGGIITPNNDDSNKFHWSKGHVDAAELEKSFHPQQKILIGAPVTLNDACPMDEIQQWIASNEYLENLGTFQSAWDISERQSGFQGGQFVNLQFNQTWVKTPSRNLKQNQLSLPDNHLLPFLQSSWGLQVSLCTSVARRVPLRELIADVMTAFVESLFPIPTEWVELKTTHGIIEAFRGPNLQDWLGQLSAQLQQLVARIVRYILLALEHTGIDQKGGHFIIAWIQKNKPFQCFKVPCEKESYWARILADSGDCATFAYITSKCLETDSLKCRGPGEPWHNASALLETSVCRHRNTDKAPVYSGQAAPWTLKHADLYSIGKPDSLLWVRVEKPVGNEHPKLHVEWSMIPRGMRFRLEKRKMPKKLERLRERQAIDAPAEQVVILAGKASRF